MSHPLDSVVFIDIPEDAAVSAAIPSFDSSIPLPVQLSAPLDGRGGAAKPDTSSLTPEMILAGILTVFAYDPENAHTAYYRSIITSIHPGIREEMTEAAILKARNGDWDLAEEIFTALRGLDPEDPRGVLNLALLNDQRADSFRNAGMDEEADACDGRAFDYYRVAMAAEPPLTEAFFNAGFFYLKQKSYRKAKEALETYLKLESPEGDTAKNRMDKARAIVSEISSRDLDDDLFKAAYDYITMGEEEKALESVRLFLEHHPRVWNAWFLLGWALRRLERWEDAKAAFTQALELGKDPNSGIESGYVDICNELAICLMELGDYAQSRSWLASALEQDPENVKIMSNLGTVALREGKREEAASFFRAALEFDPKDRLAAQMLQELS